MNITLLKRWSMVIFLVILLTVVRTTVAENWPHWRGPNHNGISFETGLPVKWSKTENVLWRLPLPGPAGATPVVWEDRIFLTAAEGDDLVLLCVSTDGDILWKRIVGSGNKVVRGDEGNSASPSPSTDGKHVWVFMSNGDLACYDFEGNEIWKSNLQKRYGEFNMFFVMASTPLLDGDRLYLQLIHSNVWLVLALDKTTGSEIWKHERKSDAVGESEQSYASPFIYRDDQHKFLLVHGADYITAHNLDDGSEIWYCNGLNPKDNYNRTLRFVASPVAAPGLIVVPSAKNGPVLGLKPGGKGNITKQKELYLWKRENNTPDVPSPLIHDGLVYLCRENGMLICMDAKTGEEVYQEPVYHEQKRDRRYRASPVYADGKIYLTARCGVVTVVKAGREFELLSLNDLEETISASPVISNGKLYLRSFDALYAIQASK